MNDSEENKRENTPEKPIVKVVRRPMPRRSADNVTTPTTQAPRPATGPTAGSTRPPEFATSEIPRITTDGKPAVKPTANRAVVSAGAPNPAQSEKKKNFFKIGFIVLAVVAALLLALCAVLFFKFSGKSKADDETISKAESEISNLESKRDNLTKERDELIKQRDELTAQVDELSKDSDERIVALQKEIDEKTATIDELNGTLDSYRSIYAVDVRRQVELVNELNELIEDGAPLHNLKEGVDPEVTKVGDLKEDGTEITEKDLYEYPNISVYYEDLSTGFKYTYNADKSVYTASVVKVLYIVSLLEDASNAYKKAVENRVNADAPLVFDNENYDLENIKWTMTEKDKKEGSGDLSGMEAGTEFTLLELVQHTIEKSDNTAFYHLREVFGYDSFNALAKKLGASRLTYSFNNCSAADVGKFMRHIYEFIESDAKYAPNLKEYMLSANHRVMIPLAVSPTKVLHKYGWDEGSYHDAGIVLADKPYIVIVFTDMEEGGDDVNEYIRKIVQTVAKLHKNFYG